MCTDKDMLWDKKLENIALNSLTVKDEENENISNKRIMPKRKAKSMVREHYEDPFILNSPPNKRSRSSLQQAKLVPAFNYGENLNRFGFEKEDVDSESDSENVKSKVSHASRISLPLPSTTIEIPKVCNRRVSVASEAWKSRKSSRWEQKFIGHGNGFSPRRTLKLKNNEPHAGVDFTDDETRKNRSGKVKGMDEHSKWVDGLYLNNCKKPLIILKRTKVLAGARFINDEYDSSERGSEDNVGDKDFDFSGILEDFTESDSDSETNLDICSEKNSKIRRRQNNSMCGSRRLIAEKKSSDKYTRSGVISNVCPKTSFSTQRVETLEAVYRRLHTSEIPERLPCREAEFERICAFIKECITNDAISQAMYVSGVPGTGKTATVLQAVRHLKASEKFSTFDFVTVNAMELADPKQIFVKIYQDLFNLKKKIAPKTARKKLNDVFQYRDKKRLPIIVLVDELDLLNTKKQEIIYDIFNWSANEESLVSVIAIANTLDLPERLFSQRISSRLGANRLCFQPYDHDEVAYIIRDRLRGSTAVEAEAIELASRKVAAISGDLRKALDILRGATELAISANQKQLTMKNVQEAIRQASTSVRVELIRALPVHSVLLLRAALAEQLSSGLDEFQFHILFKQYRLQCNVANINPVSTSAAYRNAMEMCSERLLVAASGTGSMSRRFRLGMTTHDVQFAFKQRISALANIVQRFGSRVREALATASEAISNAVVDNDPITTPVESMSRFIKDMNEKGMAGLASEYRKIDVEDAPFGSHKAFIMNMAKNRYSDVLCVDETRVVLKIGPASSGDYIHANYVLFSEFQNKFICTQGPLQTTRDDFWRMVFQERAETILMLCRPSEDGKPKCAVYWPENGDKLELSTVDVEKVGEENSDFEILLFKVQLKDEFKQSPSVSNKDPLVVKQYRWSTWPDRGIPSHENAMIPLKLLSLVRNTRAPCVVHCSAGIGRTGTVVAIELGIRRFHDGRKVDLAMLVKDLRKKRAQCIQTEIQYLYLSRVLTEYALSSGEPLSDDVRRAAESFLKEYDSKIKK